MATTAIEHYETAQDGLRYVELNFALHILILALVRKFYTVFFLEHISNMTELLMSVFNGMSIAFENAANSMERLSLNLHELRRILLIQEYEELKEGGVVIGVRI